MVDSPGNLSPVMSPIQHEIEDEPSDSEEDVSEDCGVFESDFIRSFEVTCI